MHREHLRVLPSVFVHLLYEHIFVLVWITGSLSGIVSPIQEPPQAFWNPSHLTKPLSRMPNQNGSNLYTNGPFTGRVVICRPVAVCIVCRHSGPITQEWRSFLRTRREIWHHGGASGRRCGKDNRHSNDVAFLMKRDLLNAAFAS